VSATVTVTLNAVIKRVTRRLAHEQERLHVLRGGHWRWNFGRYFVVNENHHLIAAHVDPEALARELGVLRSWEAVR
jgi:hypothetical protein